MKIMYLFIFLLSSEVVRAACMGQPSAPCRYPEGDDWCYQRYGNIKPYAYKDNCSQNSEEVSVSDKYNFSQYNTPIYKGVYAKPDFSSLQGSSGYRTRIREGIKKGVNFAGYYTVISIGCGAGCSFSILVNAKTGKIIDFPLGGEEYYAISLGFIPTSRLMRVSWEVFADNSCKYQYIVLENESFQPLGEVKDIPCENRL